MHFFRFENRSEPVASRQVFAARMLRHLCLALAIIAVVLVFGAAAYYLFFRPDDSFWMAIHRAAMIIFGMGPADEPKNGCERAFIDIYALLSLLLPLVVGLLLAPPAIHRIIHHLHRSGDDGSAGPN